MFLHGSLTFLETQQTKWIFHNQTRFGKEPLEVDLPNDFCPNDFSPNGVWTPLVEKPLWIIHPPNFLLISSFYVCRWLVHSDKSHSVNSAFDEKPVGKFLQHSLGSLGWRPVSDFRHFPAPSFSTEIFESEEQLLKGGTKNERCWSIVQPLIVDGRSASSHGISFFDSTFDQTYNLTSKQVHIKSILISILDQSQRDVRTRKQT